MDDRVQQTDKQKKLASARKKLKQFQKKKTPTRPAAMDERGYEDGEIQMSPAPVLGDHAEPHIDDMSTWPSYNLDGDQRESGLDYSLNSSRSEPVTADHGRLNNGSGSHNGDDHGGHVLEGHSGHGGHSAAQIVDFDGLDTDHHHAGDALTNNVDTSVRSPRTLVEDRANLDHSVTSYQSGQPSPAAHNAASPFQREKTTASTEGLQQLSRKINGLISESKDYLNGDVIMQSEDSLHELEQRNRELASSVEKLYQENEKLRMGTNELKQHNVLLTGQLEEERRLFDERLRREMGSVKEQLQVHIQTIGILVAEKSELQSSVQQSQKDAEKRLREVEELSGRLKASRTRVNELEREISTSTTSSQHFEKSKNDLSKEVERLRLEVYNCSKSLDETKRQNVELQEKLNAKTMDCETYDQSIANLKHMVEMKDVLIQQLSNQPNDVHDQALDIMQQERVELINRLEQYNEAFHQLTAERDHITDQYQTYIDQLTGQVRQHESRVSQLAEDKERLSLSLNEAQELNESLTEQLGKKAASVPETVHDTERVADLQSRIDSLTTDYRSLTLAYEEQNTNNTQLTKYIEERDSRIAQLESELELLRDETADKGQLLDSIQNDRASLSRALTQNKQLRQQLEELQTAFVKVQNENMDLATGFSTMEHHSKQYVSRLHFLETELDDKIGEISTLSEKLEKANSDIEDLTHSSLVTTSDDSENEHMHRNEDILALEQKYMAITKERAELVDKNERLEHKITQLEGETDTIGEYITRYHHERALLNERQEQREYHLGRLAQEREELNAELNELKMLVAEVIRDRQSGKEGTVLERRRRERPVKDATDDDWPSEDSSTESDSVVEAVEVGADGGPRPGPSGAPDHVHRIFNLLEEMGSKHANTDILFDTKFSPVKCCTGPLQVI